jgi:hypothetical protein
MAEPGGVQAGPLLGVVVPVKSIDAAALDILRESARAAQAVEFTAVGDALVECSGLPANLKIVRAQCNLYEAMNAGLERATAAYLLFMGIDDRLIAKNVPAVLAGLTALPPSPLVALPFVQNGRTIRLAPPRRGLRAFHHQGVLFRRTQALQLDGYSLRYRLHSDLDLMFRMQRLGPAGWIDVPLVVFALGGMTTSGRNSRQSMREFNQIYRAHGASRLSPGYLVSIAYLAWFRIRFLLVDR